MTEKNTDSDAQLASHNTTIRNSEVQLGQISQALNTRPNEELLSDMVVNPKGRNTGHAMAVTTRRERGGVAKARIDIDENVEETQEEVNPSREHVIDMPEPVVPKAKASMLRPLPPYPQRPSKQYNENQFKKFIDMMKRLSINVPLVEALEQMSGYAKFMKDLVIKKRLMNYEMIKMTHHVSAIVHSMAPKLEDPGAFTIPCTIRSADFAKALCDLGASIYLMPYSVFKKLGIGQPRPTSMRLQMVGYGVPIILGRPFLVTWKALVDVEDGELTFRMDREKLVFHVCKSMRQPNSNEVCSFVDLMTEVIVDYTSAMINVEDTLEVVLLNHDEDEKEGFVDCFTALQGIRSYTYEPRKLSLDLKNRKTPPTNPSIEEPPTLELKPLPSHLRYEFLVPCSTLHILISPEDQEKTTFTCPYGTFTFLRMPFGLCNTPTNFQQCMIAIFTDMVEDFLEVFMDDFSVMGNSFEECLDNLDKVLARCEETNLILNWDKCHFMVKEGIVLGHKISKNGIEVDKAKNEVISKLPPPTSVKGVRSFLGHAGFYRRFIKDFSKVVNPLCKLLEKDSKFLFNEDCMKAFELLKYKFTTTHIITAPNWSLAFELMCDASDVAVRVVLGQRINKIFHPVYYASKIMNEA
ncbi:uncharacterized protein [Nicotiana tomentosiformis]|uniref:uncharacterized protein n=1 Tax=Nicotiana tomentosiformis TaxID=4098 RepID=UPI00388C9458